jgi:hypothetical protein
VTLTRASLAVTAASLPRWRAGLALLSLDRCAPLFAELDLPGRLTAEPTGLLAAARAAVETLHHSTGRSDSAGSVAKARSILDEAFHRLATDYDETTVGELEGWLTRYVLSEPTRAAFLVWRELLRRLCCLVTRDDLTVPTSLNSVAMLRICQAVHRYLASEPLAKFLHLLQKARALPRSTWEENLERLTRHEVGGQHHLEVVGQVLDLAKIIGADARTARAWADLRATTSAANRVALHSWARRQAEALGMPREARDHEPFREPPAR